MEDSTLKKTLEKYIYINIIFEKQCDKICVKTNGVLCFINGNFTFQCRNYILPLYKSMVCHRLEYCSTVLDFRTRRRNNRFKKYKVAEHWNRLPSNNNLISSTVEPNMMYACSINYFTIPRFILGT